MKISFTLLLITLTTFSGVEPTEGEPDQTQPTVAVFVENKKDTKTDSLRGVYYNAIIKRNISLDGLIAEKRVVDKENQQLHAEIKKLKKINEFLRQNKDTVYIHDTTFKKRKFYQIFKR